MLHCILKNGLPYRFVLKSNRAAIICHRAYFIATSRIRTYLKNIDRLIEPIFQIN